MVHMPPRSLAVTFNMCATIQCALTYCKCKLTLFWSENLHELRLIFSVKKQTQQSATTHICHSQPFSRRM